MEKDRVKQAFSKVKEDISFLNREISSLKSEIIEIKELLKTVHNDLNTQKLREIAEKKTSTLRQITSTHPEISTDTSTLRQEIEGLKSPNLGVSTGNEGASTDRQTDTSTDTSTHKIPQIKKISENENIESNIQEASEILNSLDTLKKQIRRKFKKITSQEMSVFSTIYQLEEQDPNNTTYKQLALKLDLSESSIRDYVQRMINKGIPIKKQKINNKKLILSISSELKKIATLSTIIGLRRL